MQKLIFSLAILVIGAAVFARLGDAGFVWKDKAIVLGDEAAPASRVDVPLTRAKQAWQPKRGEIFEPLAPSVWALSSVAAKAKSGAELARHLHALSFAFHMAAAIVVFLILAPLLQSHGAAFIGALVFALHPLQVEPVAYIGAFKFVVGGFFALVAIWQYLAYAQGREPRGKTKPMRHYYVALIAYVLALTASAATVVTPILAWLLEKLLPKKTSLIATRTPRWPLLLWVALAIPQILWTAGSQSTQALASQLPFWTKPIVAADAVSFYLSKIFVPVLIGPDYGRSPAYIVHHWWGFLTWILPVTLILALGYWRGRQRTWYGTATAILAAGVLPFLGLIYFEAQATSTVANRFAYLAMLAPALAAGYTVSMPKKGWWAMAVVGAVVAAGWLSRQELRYWQSDATLWSHAVDVNPTSPIAHQTLADAFRRDGDWQNAKLHYEKVLETNALTPDTYFYLGEIERQHGEPQKAMDHYKKTIELDPGFAEAYVRLGGAYLDKGDREQALANFQKAVELKPDSEEPLRSLGMLYVRKGEYAQAIPYLQKALRMAENAPPTAATAETHALLGLALVKTKQPEVAQSHLEAAVALAPEHQEANRVLGDIYFAQGKYDLARPRYEKSLASNAHDFEALDNMGIILADHKEYARAAPYFAKALEIRPQSPQALNDIGVCYFHMRQLKEAEDAFHKALAIREAADPHYYLGDIMRWQGKEPEATAEYYRALKIDPFHVDANYRLGNYYMKQDKVSTAIRHYQAALKTAPDDTRLIYSLKKAEKAKGGDGTAAATF